MLSDFLQANPVKAVVVECPNEVRTAAQAARELKVPISSIAKSILFLADGEPVLAVLSGSARVSPSKLCALRHARECRLAYPEEVLEMTGYEVGAVPPVSVYGVPILLDAALAEKAEIVCGGGSPKKLLKISPQEIRQWGFDVQIAEIAEPTS